MTTHISVLAAFGAGLVSFLSPCVLPLIPAYISFMTGLSVAELTDSRPLARKVLGPVLLFVTGFTVVFVALGASASVLGSLLVANRALLTRLAGALLVLLGVVLLDVIPLPFARGGGMDAATFRRLGPGAALALGAAFPFALGPCAGPIYGAILALAMDSGSVGTGALLLLVYSIGLAVPFVVVSLLLVRVSVRLQWLSSHSKGIQRTAGAVLILLGLAMVTGLVERAAPLLRSIPLIGGIG